MNYIEVISSSLKKKKKSPEFRIEQQSRKQSK